MKMTIRLGLAFFLTVFLNACANLDERGNAVLGGAVGGAAGAAIGHEVGGRDGAVLGAGAGAAAGAAIGQNSADRDAVEVRRGYHDSGHREVRVPKGHMPPPGKCRVWYPDRPPGHQPPPGDCGYLYSRVPVDAVLVEGR